MSVQKDYQTVGRWAREIVAKRVVLTQAVGQGAALLVLTHVLNVQQSATITNTVAGAISGLATIIGVLWSRDATTPADPALRPTSVAGELLVPARQAVGAFAAPPAGAALDPVFAEDPEAADPSAAPTPAPAPAPGF